MFSLSWWENKLSSTMSRSTSRWRQFSLSSYKRIFLPCCDTTFATIMIYVASYLHNEVIKIYKVSKDMICTFDTFDLQNVGSNLIEESSGTNFIYYCILSIPSQKYLIINILSK